MTAARRTDQVPATPTPNTRSARLADALDVAASAGRSVLLTGHTDDVLVGSNGELLRNPQWLAEWGARRGRDLIVVDERGIDGRPGAYVLHPPGRSPRTPIRLEAAPLAALVHDVVATLRTSDQPTVILVDYCCIALDRDDGDLRRALAEVPIDPRFTAGRHLLVAAFPTRSPRELSAQPGWALVDVGLPDQNERQVVLASCEQRSPIPRATGLPLDRVATNMGGLTADALLRLVDEARERRPLSDDRIAELKAAEIRRLAGETLAVEALRRPMADLAGLANLKLYLAECEDAGLAPGVILLAGPPGTGKTRSWLAVADHLGVPAVRLGQVRSRYVGDSENNWATARRVLEATAPSCVLLDEADQAGLGSRGADLDAGVSARLRAELWDFLNSCGDIGITVIATTNNPDGLDPAALDRVRVLPVLHPTHAEAVQILMIEAVRLGLLLDMDAGDALAEHPGLLTGRQVVRLLNNATRAAASAGHRGRITRSDMAAAVGDSIAVGNDAGHEAMALSALLLADSRTAWPWVAAARIGEPAERPRYLDGLLDGHGEVDVAKVRARLDALRTPKG